MASIRKRTWPLASGEVRTAWLTSYHDQTGARRHRQFKTRKAATEFLTQASYEIATGVHSPSSRLTVGEAVQLWLSHAETECDPVTLRAYRSAAAHHVLPFIADKRCATLTRPMIERYRDDLLKGAVPDGQPRSRVMARKAIQALSAALGEAQRLGLLAQNVAGGIRIRTARGEDRGRLEVGRDVPSKAEIAQMLTTVSPRWRPMFVVGVFCGLRSSELRGLAWEHVDFKARVLRVRQRADIWGGLGRTKSRAGERDVPLAPMALNALREWRLACPPSEDGLVFPNKAGRPWDPSVVYRETFGAVQVACGLVTSEGRQKYGPHAFRHFTASWLIDQDFGPKWIMTVMGHANISMTYDTYGHWMASEGDHDRLAAAEAALVVVK